jgi:uncharacterized surface protein with fasciclin (FAS1) repeats
MYIYPEKESLMKRNLNILLVLALTVSGQLSAQKYKTTETAKVTKTYNGIEFSSERTLLENLSEADGFSIYAAILKNHAEQLFTEDFMGTVFVVVDEGFQNDSENGEETVIDVSDPITQKEILHFLTVPGRIDAYSLKKAVDKGGGTAYYRTVSGEKLRIRLSGSELVLADNNGNTATILASDLYHKHGFFHIVNGVISPDIAE